MIISFLTIAWSNKRYAVLHSKQIYLNFEQSITRSPCNWEKLFVAFLATKTLCLKNAMVVVFTKLTRNHN